jgi:hypothetical protein
MIPDLIILKGALWPVLPPGIHSATIEDIQLTYCTNPKRAELFKGLTGGLQNLFKAGCRRVFLDGSYITGKPMPNDYEICWDAAFVAPAVLDPVFLDFNGHREAQKDKYQGEYFPSIMVEGFTGKPFLDFFQMDKETGQQKGIILLLNYLT